MIDKIKYHAFDHESKRKIGAVTYIVVAHFDENRENVKTKIKQLLSSEIDRQVNSQFGHSQSSVV